MWFRILLPKIISEKCKSNFKNNPLDLYLYRRFVNYEIGPFNIFAAIVIYSQEITGYPQRSGVLV
jgi:hypothetical protein